MRYGDLARNGSSLLRRPETWLTAAVVLGAAGSWTMFEPPERQVAQSSDNTHTGDRDSALPTLSVDDSALRMGAEPGAGGPVRAVFLAVEPAGPEESLNAGRVEPANWQAPMTPAWLTGTIEELDR